MATTQMEAMPREFNLTAPATMPQARTYMFKRQSDLQTYDLNKGNRIRVNIPRLQRTYLAKGTYLRFRVNMDIKESSKGICFDRSGAYGLFDRLEVYDYLGGTLIEQVQNIPALTVLMNDINSGFTDLNGKRQATEGFAGAGIQVKDPPPTEPLDTPVEVCTAQSGAFVFPKTDVITFTTGQFVTKEFSIHLPSFLDMFSDKYVPLHNGFSIDLYLNSADQAFVSRNASQDAGTIKDLSVWLSNVELCCQVTELGDYAEKLMLSTSDPWVIHSKFYRYFTDIINAKSDDGNTPALGNDGNVSQSTFRLDLNLNVVSLRNIFFGMRPRFYQNKIEYPSYGHRIRNYLENFNFQYGSSYLPEIAGVQCRAVTVPSSHSSYASVTNGNSTTYPSGVSPLADSFCQALEELSKTSNTTLTPSINPEEFRIDCGSGKYGNANNARLDEWVPYRWNSTCRCGKFAGGLNLQLSNRGAVCGLDTNGLHISLNGTFNADAASANAPNTTSAGANVIYPTTTTPMVTAILDCWAEHDAFVQIIPGVATTVTF
jgi:hypothetical protein